MAVNCLTKAQQTYLVDSYRNKGMTLTELAKCFGVSSTTVRRIIRDAGEVTPELRAKEEAHRVMTLLKKFNVGYYQLEILLKHAAKEKLLLKPIQIATKQQTNFDLSE